MNDVMQSENFKALDLREELLIEGGLIQVDARDEGHFFAEDPQEHLEVDGSEY